MLNLYIGIMPKSAKKKKVINSPKKRVENKANSKVMKGGMEVNEAGGGVAPGRAIHQDLAEDAIVYTSPLLVPGIPETSQPETSQKVEDLINNLIGLTPDPERRQINAEHFNNLFNTIGETNDLLSQVLGDPGGGFLKRIFNLGDSFPYDKLRNFMLGGSSNITQCNQTVGKKDYTMDRVVPCIWCGAQLDDASECEHVLPVVAAVLLLTFSGGPNPELKRIIEWLLEYGWSHQLCNQVKSNDLFITTIDLPGGRMFVPNFNVLVERFYKVVKTNNSKCWSPTPRTNPALSKQVRDNCNALLRDIANINQGHMVNASIDNIQIRGGGIAFMDEKPGVYPANLFFRKLPDNTLGNLDLGGDLNGVAPQIDFPKGPPTSLLHWDNDINLGIKGHPIVFLFNICRYLNLTKRGLLTRDKTAQREELIRFFTGIRQDDLLQLLSNTTESLVDETVKAELVSGVNSILGGIKPALQTFIIEEREKQRTFFEKVKRFTRNKDRSRDEVLKAVRKRAGEYDKVFKVLEKDLKRIKKSNTATYDAIIMSFNQNSFPKSLNEFKTYVSDSIIGLMVSEAQTGRGRMMDKQLGGADELLIPITEEDYKNKEFEIIIDGFIGSHFGNILPIISHIRKFVSEIIIPDLSTLIKLKLKTVPIPEDYSHAKVLKIGELFGVNQLIGFSPPQLAEIIGKLSNTDDLFLGIPKDDVIEAARGKQQADISLFDLDPKILEERIIRIIRYEKKVAQALKARKRGMTPPPKGNNPMPPAPGSRWPSIIGKKGKKRAQVGPGRIRKKSQKGKKPMNKKNPTKKKKNTNKN